MLCQACTLLVLSAAAAPAQQPPVLSNVSFEQADWYDWDGVPFDLDSSWGRMSFEYPPGDATWYLNVVLAGAPGGSEAWAVQNLPLLQVDNDDYSPLRAAADLDLNELGFSRGQDWTQAWYGYTVDPVVRTSPPAGALSGAPVASLRVQAWGWFSPGAGPPAHAGRPDGVKLAATAVKANSTRKVRAVQEAPETCVAGSFGRSLDWLNQEHGLGLHNGAQQIYADLVRAGVSNSDEPDREELWIERKAAWTRAQTGDRVVTKVYDADSALGDINGVKQYNGNGKGLLAWIKQELQKGEDVELCYQWADTVSGARGGHCVTLVDLYESGGATYVELRDDETQGDVNRGDAAVKTRRLQLGVNDGRLYLGDGNGSKVRQVVAAISESLVSETPGERKAGPFDLESASGDNRLLGCEDAWGSYWVSGAGHTSSGLNRRIHRFDRKGNYRGSFPQATASPLWGGRDGAALEAEHRLFFGAENGELAEYVFDPAAGALSYVTTHWIPGAGTIRALCVDPASGHFYTKDFQGPIYEFDLNGTIHQVHANPGVSAYGFAWDEVRSTIWATADNAAAVELDPATGQATGLGFATALGGAQGGCDLSVDWRNHGRLSLLMLHQGTPDQVALYNVTVTPNDNSGPVLDLPELVAGASATLRVLYATPGAQLPLAYSTRGAGPAASAWGVIRLTPPYATLATLRADAAGQAALTSTVPAGTAGLEIWLQALDLGAGRLSNGAYARIR